MDRIDKFFEEIESVKPKPFIKSRIEARMAKGSVPDPASWLDFEFIRPVAIVALVAALNIGFILSLESQGTDPSSDIAQEFGFFEESNGDLFSTDQ